MIGQTISHYRILEELGRGGMGVVYRAHDTKLDRLAALKVLKPELLEDEEHRQRFLREARSAAAVTHPFIASIYDAGEADGTLFIAMEFVEGNTLRALLSKGPLHIPEAKQYATEIAEGLAKAHQAGLVHRDMKPDNVMIASDGHAKILDFGLAKVAEKRDEAATVTLGKAEKVEVTTQGAILGTPAYMSPEQARGEPVDSRSDIFSFGSTVYEMVTGKSLFQRSTYTDTLASILRDEPLSPHDSNPTVPGELNCIISRCLRKRPEDRYNDTRDLVVALRDLQAVTTPTGIPVAEPSKRWGQILVAVVALVAIAALAILQPWQHARNPDGEKNNSTADTPVGPKWILVADFAGPPNDPNLAHAAQELTSAALSLSDIVMPLTRAQLRLGLELAMKPDTTRIRGEVARELAERASCKVYVEGRVDRVLSGYSIILNVIDVKSNALVASVSRVAENEERFISILDGLVRELRMRLGEKESVVQNARPIRDVMTPSFAAYKKYVQGVLLVDSKDRAASTKTFMEALELDREFAAAWIKIGINYGNNGMRDSARVAFERAAQHPGRLTEYDRHSLELGIAYRIKYDLASSLRILDLFIQEHPTDPNAYNNRGVVLASLGRPEEALASYTRALELAPWANPLWVSNTIRALIGLGRFDEAQRLVDGLEGRWRVDVELPLALCRGQLQRAESLATHCLNDASAGEVRVKALVAEASIRGSRGAFRSADSLLAVAIVEENSYYASTARLMLHLACVPAHLTNEMPRFPPKAAMRVVLLESAWAAVHGDTASATRYLKSVDVLPEVERQRYQSDLALLPLFLAMGSATWAEVVRDYDRIMSQHPNLTNYVFGNVPLFWVVGVANEELGRLQSAAKHFELALVPTRWLEIDPYLPSLISPLAHYRLVLLYSKMGRVEDARRHWEIFEKTFTTPDPELVPMIEEARQALAEAEAKIES